MQPFVFGNFWHAFAGTDSTIFNEATILPTQFQATSFEIGGGLVAKVASNAGIYARGSYTTNLDDVWREIVKGQVGLRFTW